VLQTHFLSFSGRKKPTRYAQEVFPLTHGLGNSFEELGCVYLRFLWLFVSGTVIARIERNRTPVSKRLMSVAIFFFFLQ